MCQSHKDEGVWTRAHITVCALHVRIQGSNVRKCVFSLYEELRVTQCSRIPPEGTQWSVRPARRNKKQKHKAFIHSPRSLYLSLARLRSSVSFYLRLITISLSLSLRTHRQISHSCFVGVNERTPRISERTRKGEQYSEDRTWMNSRSHLHAYPACSTASLCVQVFLFIFLYWSTIYTGFNTSETVGRLRAADTLYLRMTNEPKQARNRLLNKTQTHLRSPSNFAKAHKLALCTQCKSHLCLCRITWDIHLTVIHIFIYMHRRDDSAVGHHIFAH